MADRRVRAVLAASVRRERQARGWSREELAARAGVNRHTVVSVELQKCGTTMDVASLLAGAFGTTIGALADDPAEVTG